MIQSRLVANTISLCVLMLAGCGDSHDGDLGGSGVLIDQRTQQATATDLLSANGTYTTCTNRSGSWSLELSSGATLAYDALSVVKNDVGCVLTLTELNTNSGLQAAVPPIALDTTYETTASAFGSPVSFYANAIINSTAYASSLVLSLRFSDDPGLVSGSQMATFDAQGATVSSASVPAPNYTLDLSALVVKTDSNDVVQSATGNATLTAGSQVGTNYAIVSAVGLTTFTAIDTAYSNATAAALSTTIAASELTLTGVTLSSSPLRTLIIANVANGIRSYQVFALTFNPATH